MGAAVLPPVRECEINEVKPCFSTDDEGEVRLEACTKERQRKGKT